MKKLRLLVISSALLLGLAACGGQTPEEPDSSFSSGDSVDYATLAQTAISNVSATFGKWSSTGIASDQKLDAEATVDGHTFAITYTIANAAKTYLSVSEDNKTLIVNPDKEDHLLAGAVVVHASINGAEKASKAFNVKVLATSLVKISEIYSMKNNATVAFRGYVTKVLVSGNILVADGDSAMLIYTTKTWAEAKVGTLVQVTGTLSIYNGLYEIKPDAINATSSAAIAKPVDLVLDGTFDATKAENQSRLVSAEGYLSSIKAAKKKSSSSGEEYNQIDATVIVGTKAQGFAHVSIHVEDRKADAGVLDTWGFDATAANCLGENAPKVGESISVSGVVDWYSTAQISNASLTAHGKYTGEYNPDEKAPEPEAIAKSVTEMLQLGSKAITNKVYKVTGVIESMKGDKYGNGYLTDPSTGASIQIYGLTGTASALTWDGAAFKFSNPGDSQTTLADVHNGDSVTAKVVYGTFNNASQISGVMLSHEASTATYKATAVSEDDAAATITLSKSEGIAYGEEITVSATSSKTGYVVDSILVENAQGVKSVVKDGKFKATCVNKVYVTFRDSAVVENNTKITATKLGVGTSYGNAENPVEIDGVSWTYNQVSSNAATPYIQINKGRTPESAIWNTTALPKAIKNIVVTYNAQASTKNYDFFVITTGTAVVTAKGTNTGTATQENSVRTYTPTGTSDTFVRFAHSEATKATVYIDSIVINFVD